MKLSFAIIGSITNYIILAINWIEHKPIKEDVGYKFMQFLLTTFCVLAYWIMYLS